AGEGRVDLRRPAQGRGGEGQRRARQAQARAAQGQEPRGVGEGSRQAPRLRRAGVDGVALLAVGDGRGVGNPEKQKGRSPCGFLPLLRVRKLWAGKERV